MEFLIPLIVGLSNTAFRGGLLKKWFPRFRGGDFLHALIFGLCLSGLGWIAACLGAVGMFIGAMPALFHPATDKALEDRNIALWARLVAARGFIWCLAIAFFLVPILWNAAWYFMACAPLMPLAYSWKWFYKRNGEIVNDWTLSEFTWGLIMGVPIILL